MVFYHRGIYSIQKIDAQYRRIFLVVERCCVCAFFLWFRQCQARCLYRWRHFWGSVHFMQSSPALRCRLTRRQTNPSIKSCSIFFLFVCLRFTTWVIGAVLKTKPDDTALLGVQPSSPLSKASSPLSMTHNSINNCSGETTPTNKYATTNHLNDITVSISTDRPHLICEKRHRLTKNPLLFPSSHFATLKPLDDTTTPLFGEIFDELILPDGYCTLLSDDINPIDTQSSKMNIIDPFINYRDEMCETAETSSSILSPDNLSKVCIIGSTSSISMESTSSVSLCGFLSTNIDLLFGAPYRIRIFRDFHCVLEPKQFEIGFR